MNSNRGGRHQRKMQRHLSTGGVIILVDKEETHIFGVSSSSPYPASVIADIKFYLSSRLKQVRESFNQSGTSICRILGISKMTLWKAVNHPTDVAIATLVAILKIFGVIITIALGVENERA